MWLGEAGGEKEEKGKKNFICALCFESLAAALVPVESGGVPASVAATPADSLLTRLRRRKTEV